jgi:hypothetical protein
LLEVALIAALALAPQAAPADLQYATTGEDLYRIESTGTFTRVSYAGTESLSIAREGRSVRFAASAQYTRQGPDGKTRGEARFVQVLQPNGSFVDRVDNDPDFLTILNQPFAVWIDGPTLRDLRAMRSRVPFSAASPLGDATLLQGFLRPGVAGPIDGSPTVAVRFEAQGPMSGTLPGYADATVSGTMRMDGTAYYALNGADLLAFSVTLTLDARLAQGRPAVSVPVRITYRRSMRATSRTPPPAPLATGGGTVAPATP